MRKDLDELLCQRYPKIFVDRHGDMLQTCMVWGFSCGDGWFQIIDDLCAALQDRTDRGGAPQAVALQVKEKFGTLRFYARCVDDEAQVLIQEAAKRSCVVCENCGEPAVMRPEGWWHVYCDDCEEAYLKRGSVFDE